MMKLYFLNKLTPLHYASEEGNIDIVKLLINNGAEINDKAKTF